MVNSKSGAARTDENFTSLSLQHLWRSMIIIRVAAIDPALTNFGMAKLDIAIDEKGQVHPHLIEMKLIQTTKQTTKQVRQNSDDLRRCKELTKDFQAFVGDCKLVFAEISTGAQSARAMYAFGAAVGILAGCPRPLIQVQPTETKLATVGTKVASKQEMIEWAVEHYPDAEWKRHRGKVTNDNEHLADAIAVGWAGVRTDQFKQLIALATGVAVNLAAA